MEPFFEIPFLFTFRPATGLYRAFMYFFFHLLAGTILGLLIGDLLGDKRWVIPCAIGSGLPDLVDKPLWLVFQSIGTGRIYGHTLLAALALGILGLLVMKFWESPVIAGMSAGVISHQILDSMWLEPRNWFYPALGEFHRYDNASDIISLLMSEITNPVEIVLFIALCAGMGIVFSHDRLADLVAGHTRTVRVLLACGIAELLLLSGIFIGLSRGTLTLILSGIIIEFRGKYLSSYLGWSRPDEFLLGAIISALAAVVLWRWLRKMPAGKTG